MRVAFATTNGVVVDEHFGRSGMFAIYEIGRDGHKLVEERRFSPEGRDAHVESTRGLGAEHDSAVQSKVDRLADCRIIFVQEIGGPSAARLTQKGIMPLKVKDVLTIEANLEKLGSTMRGNPPLWLRKSLDQE